MAIYHEDIADINLNGGSMHRSFKTVSIGSGDKNANRFGMRVFRDGAPVDLSNVECQAVFQDPMGNNIALTSHGYVSGNIAYVTLPQACYNHEGNFCLAIKLIGGGVTGTMRIVDGVINNTNTGNTVAPTSAVPTYQEILAVYEEMVTAIARMPEFDESLLQIAGKTDILYGVGYTNGYYISNTGVITANADSKYSDLITLPENTYKLTLNKTNSSGHMRIHGYDSNGTWVKLITDWNGETGKSTITFDTKGLAQIRISYNYKNIVPILLTSKGTVIDNADIFIKPFEFTYTNEGKAIYFESGEAINSSNFATTNYIDLGATKKITYSQIQIATNNNVTNGMAFYDKNRDYISGIMSGIGVEARGTKLVTINVPDGAAFARFTTWNEEQRELYGGFMLYDADEYDAALEKKIKDNEEEIETERGRIDMLYVEKTYPNWEQGGIRFSDAKYTDNTNRIRIMDTVSIADGYISCKTTADGYCFYVLAWDMEGNYIGTYAGNGAFTKTAGSVIMIKKFDFSAYPNYKFKIVERLESNADLDTTAAQYVLFYSFRTISIPSVENIPIGLHTMPKNQGVLNVIRRCRQMTDIRWTPAVDLPRLMRVQTGWDLEDTVSDDYFRGTFKAGREYTGIPYGRANDITAYGYNYGYVGKYISFETFITSVENENSMLCKESQFSLADHASVLYAAVCSALTCYALNVPYVATQQIPSINGLTLVGKINDDGTLLDQNMFQLGQVLNLQGKHTGIITDIIKDKSGNVLCIEISEGTVKGIADKNYADGPDGGLCMRRGWTLDEIYYKWGDFSVYNYSKIESVPFEPSSFAEVDGMKMFHIRHYPCMPYQGEGFKFKEGYIPNTDILISPNLGYGYLRVFKDGEEYTGSPFTVTSETEKISIGFSETGEYEAYLSTMQDGHDVRVSYPCHWSVV